MAAMQAASLEVLEAANVPPGQARAIVRAIEIEIAGARDVLATKDDIQLLRSEMPLLRFETAQEIERLRSETKLEFATVRQDMTEIRRGLEVRVEGLGREMHSVARDNLRTMTGVVVGSMTAVLTVVLGVVYFLFTHGVH